MKIGDQSFEFNNVYLESYASAIGKLEAKSKIKSYVDIVYKDSYLGEESFEKAERKMQRDTINKAKSKALLIDLDIDLAFGGDLINQEIITTHTFKDFDIPFVGLWGACSTFALSVIEASIHIDSGNINRALAMASSHNSTAERTYRYPIEYGGAKEDTQTFTVTGCGVLILSNRKSKIKVTRATIGKIIDIGFTDQNDMGSAMAPSAAETLLSHFKDFKITPKDYDLILTGDLSQIGHSILFDAINREYKDIKNLDDCGLIVYDYFDQNVFSGGSGCGCCAVVTASYVINKMLMGELNKVLICATGALMNQTSTLQKENIPAVSHCFCLEVVK